MIVIFVKYLSRDITEGQVIVRSMFSNINVLIFFNLKDKPYSICNSREVTEVHAVALKETVEKVDWSQNTFGDLSEAREVLDDNDEDVGEVVRQAQVHCSASGSPSTFIKDLGRESKSRIGAS